MDKLRSKLDNKVNLTFETLELASNAERGYAVMRLDDVVSEKRKHLQDPYQPHRVNFHALLHFTAGFGEHWVDEGLHEIRPNTLLHIYPNQLHHFVESGNLDAVVVLFLPSLLPVDFHNMSPPNASVGSTQSFFESLKYQWPQVAHLRSNDSEILRQQIQLLFRYQSDLLDHEFQLATRHQLCSLIALAHQFAIQAGGDSGDSTLPPLFVRFVELLEQSYTQSRDAKWYATTLECAYRTLSRTCTNTTGKSPKTLIDERVTTEATRRLAYSNESISQIGTALGFEENTNFTKFFRRNTGSTPEEFRRTRRLSQ